jgi:hypothetical protein
VKFSWSQARTSRRVAIVAGVVVAVASVSAGGTAAAFALSSGTTQVSVTPIVHLPPGSRHLSIPSTATPSTPSTTTTPSTTPTPATTPAPSTAPSTTVTTSKIISDTCFYSHEANDDPILNPGQPGQAMAHDFFGNTTTSASSTAASLLGGPTTCSTSADASAYWTPVLYQNGAPITPTRNLIYWAGLQTRRPTAAETTASVPSVTAPPAGLELIAGDENAMAPQSTKVVGWRCTGDQGQPFSAVPVDCPGTNGLELRIDFPSCWNGTTLNGASQTNAAYPTKGGRCPTGYPVRIPTVIFHVVYRITSAAGLTLSMGPGQQGSVDTAHGDFINGWNQSVLTGLISGCAGSAHTCGHVTGSGSQLQVHPRSPSPSPT